MDTDKRNNPARDRRGRWKAGGQYVQDLLQTGIDGPVGKGVELGLGAVMARTMLHRLPVPLNIVAPFVAEKVILKYGVESGRDMLLKGLKWIQRMTEEKPRTQTIM
jgi:hypothetical protein